MSATDLQKVFEKEGERLKVALFMTPDRLKLFLDVEVVEHRGAIVHNQEIFALVKEFIAEDRLDVGVINDIAANLRRNNEVRSRRIAKGRAPNPGGNGKLLLLVKKYTGRGEVLIDDKGFADYRALQLFDNIKREQVVARLYPAQEGTSGEDVFGEPLLADKGKDVAVEIDPSLKLLPAEAGQSYQEIRAQLEGYLSQEKDKLSIVEELVIKGDLDVRLGNLHFIGKIKVLGDVKPEIEVRAEKGIEVKGNIHKGHLVCPNADIIVHGIVHGGGVSRVVAGGSFSAKSVANAILDIKGSLHVAKEIRDSCVRCLGSVHLEQGTLIGGSILTVCGMEAKQYGNAQNVVTQIALSSDLEATAEYAELSTKVASHEKVRDLLRLNLGIYAEKPERVSLLKVPFRSKMEQMLAKYKSVETSLLKVVEKRQLYLQSAKVQEKGMINVLSSLFPGVELRARDKEFHVAEVLKGPKSVVFTYSSSEFSVEELSALQCDLQPQSAENKTS